MLCLAERLQRQHEYHMLHEKGFPSSGLNRYPMGGPFGRYDQEAANGGPGPPFLREEYVRPPPPDYAPPSDQQCAVGPLPEGYPPPISTFVIRDFRITVALCDEAPETISRSGEGHIPRLLSSSLLFDELGWDFLVHGLQSIVLLALSFWRGRIMLIWNRYQGWKVGCISFSIRLLNLLWSSLHHMETSMRLG